MFTPVTLFSIQCYRVFFKMDNRREEIIFNIIIYR